MPSLFCAKFVDGLSVEEYNLLRIKIIFRIEDHKIIVIIIKCIDSGGILRTEKGFL